MTRPLWLAGDGHEHEAVNLLVLVAQASRQKR